MIGNTYEKRLVGSAAGKHATYFFVGGLSGLVHSIPICDVYRRTECGGMSCFYLGEIPKETRFYKRLSLG